MIVSSDNSELNESKQTFFILSEQKKL